MPRSPEELVKALKSRPPKGVSYIEYAMDRAESWAFSQYESELKVARAKLYGVQADGTVLLDPEAEIGLARCWPEHLPHAMGRPFEGITALASTILKYVRLCRGSLKSGDAAGAAWWAFELGRMVDLAEWESVPEFHTWARQILVHSPDGGRERARQMKERLSPRDREIQDKIASRMAQPEAPSDAYAKAIRAILREWDEVRWGAKVSERALRNRFPKKSFT